MAPKFTIDVTKTPNSALRSAQVRAISAISACNISRGCPFTCEFCDIIELYGRVPRTKTHDADARRIGSALPAWISRPRRFRRRQSDRQQESDQGIPAGAGEVARRSATYPFEFSTEASLNLADDAELLAHAQAGEFLRVFVGHRKPRYRRYAIGHAQKAEYAPQHRRQRPQDLSRRHVRDRGLHRRLRQREGLDGRSDDRSDRGVRRSPSPWWACSMRCPIRSSRAGWPRRAASMSATTPRPKGKGDQMHRRRRITRPSGRVWKSCAITAACWRDLRPRRVLRQASSGFRPCSIAQTAASEIPEGDIRRRDRAPSVWCMRCCRACPSVANAFGRRSPTACRAIRGAVRAVVTLMAFYLHIGPYYAPCHRTDRSADRGA